MPFPVHLRLDGRIVLVVGAGPVGRRRVAALREAGAVVRWVAPDAPPSGLRAVFEPAHLDGVRLAFACASPAVNAAVVAAARAQGVLVGRADRPEAGDLDVPARVRRGRLLLSLGTGGAAPAATRALRQALEERVPRVWSEFVERMADARARLRGAADRAARLEALANPLLEALEAGDQTRAEALCAAAATGDR